MVVWLPPEGEKSDDGLNPLWQKLSDWYLTYRSDLHYHNHGECIASALVEDQSQHYPNLSLHICNYLTDCCCFRMAEQEQLIAFIRT